MDFCDYATTDLERLLSLLESGELRNPPSAVGLESVGLGDLRSCDLQKQTPEANLAALQAVLHERRKAPVTQLDLVWSGPDTGRSHARSTGVVLRELFRQARKSVVLGGCYTSCGKDIFKPLHAAMRDHGVRAIFCLDLAANRKASTSISPESRARALARKFLEHDWPFGTPIPEIYYDPESLKPNAKGALHAKCVVIDEEISLVTSANFTYSGQGLNIEVGVQIENRDFAQTLSGQFLDLISHGHLIRCLVGPRDVWNEGELHQDSDWEEFFEDIEEEYLELAKALAQLGVRAPQDFGSDLAVGTTMSGLQSLLDWTFEDRTLQLVPKESQEGLAPGSPNWIYVAPDDDPEHIAGQINSFFLRKSA